MCTVTLIPDTSSVQGFILTSNRDEAANRQALFPDIYMEEGVKMLYPKDKVAGGTWIGISERKRLICLLNGEFKKHVRKDSYRLSRGVVVKELLAAKNFDETIKKYDFEGVEPFTIILVDWYSNLKFIELVWDGKLKHYKELDIKTHIWSSSPLYSEEMKLKRISWFERFLEYNKLNPESLWNFHHSAGEGDSQVDLIMDRGFVKTTSVTQIIHTPKESIMRYEDLKLNKNIKIDLSKEFE